MPGEVLGSVGQKGLDPKALARAHRHPDDVDLPTPGSAEPTVRLDLSQVVDLLGDSDPRAVDRSVERWTGRPPTAWRGHEERPEPVTES